LHGMWLIAPVALGATTFGLLLDALWRRTPAARALAVRTGLATIASLAGLINPLGWSSLLLPLRFRDAGDIISEWHPATVYVPDVRVLLGVIAIVVAGWVFGPRPPLAELVFVAAWAVFGSVTIRNALISLLLLAPVAVAALHRSVGPWLSRFGHEPGRRERRMLAGLTLAATATAIVLPVAALRHVDPLARADARPIALRLAEMPSPVRVLDDYNASGQLVAFGGGKVRLMIDGRFDMWGADAVHRIGGVEQLSGDWQATLRELRPDAMVIPATSPLAAQVQRDRSWHVVARNDPWLLLLPGAA